MSSSTCLFIYTVLILLLSARALSSDNKGVLDKIKAGLQYASNYLDTARDIADLVSQSLRRKASQKRGDDGQDIPENSDRKSFGIVNLINAFFRLFGLDAKKVTAIAVNSFIFFSQMISTLFELAPPLEDPRNDRGIDEELAMERGMKDTIDPIKIITESKNERVQNLLKLAQNPDLPSFLIDRADGLDSACVRLLVCKTSPIIWAVQDRVKNNTRSSRNDITSWLPTKDEFEENADLCDQQHSECAVILPP